MCTKYLTLDLTPESRSVGLYSGGSFWLGVYSQPFNEWANAPGRGCLFDPVNDAKQLTFLAASDLFFFGKADPFPSPVACSSLRLRLRDTTRLG
jgi:hypothetical protein